jgi:subtilisin family serine protease
MLSNKIRVLVFQTAGNLNDILKDLGREPGILGAQPDFVYRTQSEPYADLQAIGRTLHFDKLHRSCKGKGVRVAVLDTGIDSKHRDIEESVVLNRNLIEGKPHRPEIHGTAVAGLIASGINGFGIEGIAPEAEILALRCLEQTDEKTPLGKGATSSISRAMDLALTEKAQVINLSFGSSAKDPLISLFLEEGKRKNVLFTAPIGNRPGLRSPLFPASSRCVVGVGGLDNNGRTLPSSHLAAQARVLAPSVRLFTTLPENRHGFQNGTSFASAIVAGILALGLEKNPNLRQEDLPPWTGDPCRWVESMLQISLKN